MLVTGVRFPVCASGGCVKLEAVARPCMNTFSFASLATLLYCWNALQETNWLDHRIFRPFTPRLRITSTHHKTTTGADPFWCAERRPAICSHQLPTKASSGVFENPSWQSVFPKPRKQAPSDRIMSLGVEMGQFGPIPEVRPGGGDLDEHTDMDSCR